MERPLMSTCPHCGKETPAGAVCRHCGRELEAPQELEVRYKDFKGTEMLDIKMASHARHEDKGPAEERGAPEDNGPRSEKKYRRAVIFLLASGIIIISALAWYYLLKFLSKF